MIKNDLRKSENINNMLAHDNTDNTDNTWIHYWS